MSEADVQRLLEDTLPHRPAQSRKPRPLPSKPKFAISRVFITWSRSQVAAYRLGLVLGYLGMLYFGASALVVGIPAFEFTTPEGWTPIWAGAVILGGLVAAIGAIRAGEEPITRDVRIFNWIELVGAVLLFLTLGGYAAVLLVIGYGYGDAGRSVVGAGFVVLGIPPAVRMIWLIFRPTAARTAKRA